jgi:hypothetical protein
VAMGLEPGARPLAELALLGVSSRFTNQSIE